MRQSESINDRLSSRRRHVYGFSAVIGLALILVAITVNALHAGGVSQRAEGWQRHTLHVLLATEKLRSSANEARRSRDGIKFG